jgi:hypothetical protein
MKPAQIVVNVVDAGGSLWIESGHLMAKRIPAHLIPHIREHKSELLALLNPNRPEPDRVDVPKYDDPAVMAQNLLTTMRAIGLQVQVTAQNELSIEPAEKLWDCDLETIEKLKPQLITLLNG